MIVINPATTAHKLKLVPRYYPSTALVLTLRNDATGTETTPSVTYYENNGYLVMEFTATFTEGQTYDMRLTESGEVVFRGKIKVTAQGAQQYQVTQEYYTYG